jgi:L-ascorbate metabolism protein UlaG (beta-lactamase superfamily)
MVGSTKVGNVTITWLGHDSFMMEGDGLVVYTDPYVIPTRPKAADIVLITHDHYDHCDAGKIGRLKKASTVIVATPRAAPQLSGDVQTMSPGDKRTFKGIEVKAVHAYNPAKPYHPKGEGMGFVFKLGGVTIYLAGDTEYIPEMRSLGHIDVALLPIGGTFTMDVDQAVMAGIAIKPKIVIPMHYGTLKETKGDPQELKNKLTGRDRDIEVRIL